MNIIVNSHTYVGQLLVVLAVMVVMSALLLVWVGIGAIIRGIAQIVMAFHVHKHPEAVVA